MVPELKFFLVRPGITVQTASSLVQKSPATIVPLVAIDELPDWIDIVGAPRELTVQQTTGLANLGTFPRPDGTYPMRIAYATEDSPDEVIEDKPSWADLVEIAQESNERIVTAPVPPSDPVATQPTPTPGATGDIPSKLTPGQGSQQPLSPSITPIANHTSPPQPHNSNLASPSRADIHPADRMRAHWNIGLHAQARNTGLQASIHNVNNSSRSPSPSSPPSTGNTPSPFSTPTTQPAPQSSDEYCRHWCHHGTCKWGQQCRYKHDMPTTPEGLVEVGLAEYPAWWVTKVLLAAGAGEGRGGGSAPGMGGVVEGVGGPETEAGAGGNVNLAAALGLGGLGVSRQGNAQIPGLYMARHGPYYAGQLAALMGLGVLGGGHGHGHGNYGFGGGQGYRYPHPQGQSNKKLKAQLREALGLLRELGFTAGSSGPGGMNLKQKGKKAREMSPLDKGKGVAVGVGAGVASASATAKIESVEVLGAGNGDVRVVVPAPQDQKDGKGVVSVEGQAAAAHEVNVSLKATNQAQDGVVAVLPPVRSSHLAPEKLIDV